MISSLSLDSSSIESFDSIEIGTYEASPSDTYTISSYDVFGKEDPSSFRGFSSHGTGSRAFSEQSLAEETSLLFTSVGALSGSCWTTT